MIAVLGMSLFSRLFGRRQERDLDERRKDIDKRQAFEEKVELDAALAAILRQRRIRVYREEDTDGH